MKRGKRYLCLGFVLMAAGYMMLCTGTAIVWAGFNGFGGIWLDYTEEGQMAIGTAGCFFLLFFVLLLVYMLVKNYRERASVKYYIYDILFWILGIAAGIVPFRLFPQPGRGIIDSIMHFIREEGFLECPAP